VPIEQAGDGTGTPLDPDRYVADFAAALASVVTDPDRAARMGRAGRERAIAAFSWQTIAERTRQIYADLP
jgi:alpha-maltose-1-phosphate synthase